MTTSNEGMKGGIRQVGKNKWVVVVSTGTRDAKGHYKQVWKTVTGNRTEAEKVRRQLLLQRDEGRLVSGNKVSLGAYLIREEDGQMKGWLANHAAARNLAPKTVEGYRQQIETHILPSLGHVRLIDLKSVLIDNFLTEKQNAGRLDKKGGLSPKSVRQLQVILHAALKDAVRQELLPSNPCDRLKERTYPGRKMHAMEVADLTRFLEAVRATAPEYHAVFHLLLFSGLRRSEALALTWRDLDLSDAKRATVSVQRSLHSVGGKIAVGKPKTKTSVRTIALPETAALTLRRYREEREAIFHDSGKRLLPEDYVFSRLEVLDERGRPLPLLPDSVTHAWIKAVRRAGLEGVRLHDARHTFVSVLIKAGVDLAVASKIAGHSSVRVTGDTYAHLLEGVKEDAARKFDQAVNQPDKKLNLESVV